MGPDGDLMRGNGDAHPLAAPEGRRDATELLAVLAAYFGCEVEDITGWVVIAERSRDGGCTLSSGWGAPAEWRVIGFLDDVRRHIENQR